jgi:hypothetical protein
LVSEGQRAWLVGAAYKAGQVKLRLIASQDLEPIEWVDSGFQPYYLTKREKGEPVRKVDLFTGKELQPPPSSFLVISIYDQYSRVVP